MGEDKEIKTIEVSFQTAFDIIQTQLDHNEIEIKNLNNARIFPVERALLYFVFGVETLRLFNGLYGS